MATIGESVAEELVTVAGALGVLASSYSAEAGWNDTSIGEVNEARDTASSTGS